MTAVTETPAPEQHKPGPNTLRDHLANERTLLAWIRTAIAVIALGFVVAKFGILLREVGGTHVHALTAKMGAVVGVLLVAAGVMMTGLATGKFMQIRSDIDRDVVRFSPTLDIALAAIIVAVSIVLAAYMIITA